MRIFFLLCLFAIPSLFAFSLKEKFEEAEAGTYIVTEQNELVSLLHLHTKGENRLIFEEISIPLHAAKKIKWSTWAAEGAPGHTSWILYEVDLIQERVTECYSHTRKAWIPTEEMEAFLVPLISLKLHFLSEEERMQKGPTPQPGSIASRPWGPPQVVEGKKIKDPDYDVYTAKWPVDHSDLSGKSIVLYFDKERKTFPFPYWLQVREGALKFKIRALDSGKGFTSPCTTIPRRFPTFTSGVHQEKESLQFSLNCPTYYDALKLYAVDLSQTPRLTHVLPFQETRKRESLTLSIDKKKVDALLTPGHEYLWILSSESPEMAIESPYRYTHGL
ncbi:MAG: hypothetical protein KDK64_07355 [Chlamydiia bacterium]|nr:hypothetical protein [Chlamydiia bacterium]